MTENGTGIEWVVRWAVRGLFLLSPLLLLGPAVEAVAGTDAFEQQAMEYAPAPLAGSTIELGLAEAVALSLRRNTQLQSAYLDRVVDQLNLAVAEAQFRPQGTIDLSAQQSRSPGDDAETQRSSTLSPTLEAELPTGGRIGFSWNLAQSHGETGLAAASSRVSNLSLDLSQPLLRGGGLAVGRAPLEIARIQEAISALSLEEQVVTVIESVINAYRSLLQEQRRLEIARLSLERTEDQLERNRAMVERGRMARNELVQTEASLANQRFNVSQSEETLEQAELELLRLLNLGRDTRLRLLDTIDLDELDTLRVDAPAVDEALDIALQNRPDYLRLRLGRAIEDVNRMLAQNNHLWRLDLVASLGAGGEGDSARSALEATLDERPGYSAGLQMEVPLFDPERPVRLLESEIRLQQAHIQFAERETELRLEVERALNDLDSRWRQIGFARQSLKLARESLEIEREKLSVGRSTSFQVNATERSLREAEQSLLNAVVAYLNAQSVLDRVLGTTLDTWGLALPEAGVMP